MSTASTSSESEATKQSPRDTRTTVHITRQCPHPIFMPRDYPYSDEEYDIIRSLGPIKNLPACLLPTKEHPSPPVMHYGWLLSKSVQEDLIHRAEEQDCVDYIYKIVFDPDYDERRPDLSKVHEVIHFVNRPLTMEMVVDALITDLGIRIPGRQFINLVLTGPDRYGGICLTLYSNHTKALLPIDQDVRKLANSLGLTDPPHWYPSLLHFEWGC